jgi:hypothetical protein
MVVGWSMDGSLRWIVQQHPPWHIAMPGAGAIHPINGGQLCRAMLTEHTAGEALRDAELLHDVIDTTAAAGGA